MRDLFFTIGLALLIAGCDDKLHQVSNSNHGAYEASMAALPDGFAVAWYDDRDGNAEIYLRLLDSEGRPKSREYRLTNGPELSYEADIAATPDGNLAIAWYERLINGDLRARLGLWTPNGQALWMTTISPPERDGRNALVRSVGNELFSAWIEDDRIFGQWWTLKGQPLTPPQPLAAASATTWNLNAAVDSQGRAWVVFDAKRGTRANELFLVRTDKTNADGIAMTADDGFASKYPDLSFGAGGRAALTWFDERDGNTEVYLFAGLPSDLHEGLEEQARRVTRTPGESMGAYVAWNRERAGLAWCDKIGDQHEIYFQTFDGAGMPLEDARRLTHTRADSLIPAIQAWADTFALAWNEYAPKGPGHTAGGRSEIVFSFAR